MPYISELIRQTARSYYSSDRPGYQIGLESLSAAASAEPEGPERDRAQAEYELCRSLACLCHPESLCRIYAEAARLLSGRESEVFRHSCHFLDYWAYDDLVEYFGSSLDRAGEVAQALEEVESLHRRFGSGAEGTALLYQADAALQGQDYDRALLLAGQAAQRLPPGNEPARNCLWRITEQSRRRSVETINDYTAKNRLLLGKLLTEMPHAKEKEETT